MLLLAWKLVEASSSHLDRLTHTLGLPYRSDQPVAKAATYTTQQTKETKFHALNGIRTRNASKQVTAGLRLRLHSHHYRHVFEHGGTIFLTNFKFWADSVSRERRDVGRTNSLDSCTVCLLLKALVNGEVSIVSQPAEYSFSAVSFLAAKHCVVK